MTQFIITLASGSKIEPTRDQSKKISEILFGGTPVVAPAEVAQKRTAGRPNRRGVRFERWTPEQDAKLREMLNMRLGTEVKSKDLREIAYAIGRAFKSVSARYYTLYHKKHNAGQYV